MQRTFCSANKENAILFDCASTNIKIGVPRHVFLVLKSLSFLLMRMSGFFVSLSEDIATEKRMNKLVRCCVGQIRSIVFMFVCTFVFIANVRQYVSPNS